MSKIFAEDKLSNLIDENINQIKNDIENEDEDNILDSNENEFIEKYYLKYHLEPLEINFEEFEKDRCRKKLPSSMFPRNYDVRPGKSYSTLIIIYKLPFSGNSELLRYRPSKKWISSWTREVYLLNNTYVCFEIIPFSRDAKSVKDEAKNIMNSMRQQLEYLNSEIDSYNNNLKSQIKNFYNGRKKRIEDDKKFLESL